MLCTMVVHRGGNLGGLNEKGNFESFIVASSLEPPFRLMRMSVFLKCPSYGDKFQLKK